MNHGYRVRWITKQRLDAVRKNGHAPRYLVLDSFNGFLIVEPAGSNLGDGPILSQEEADYELRPVWCGGAKTKLKEARKLLGLPAELVTAEYAEASF